MAEEQKAQPREGQQIQIGLDEDVAQGIYSNLAMVNHNQTEFTIDFIYVQPQGPKAKVRARVITSPSHFKRLIAAMNDNLAKYEAKFGIVEIAPPQLNVPVH
jgi:hypothetical protein